MKVLILGATGFIGFPTAQALVRAGHIVYGQTRSEESKGDLVKEEIVPVVLDPSSDEGVKAFVEVAKDVDLVIDTVPFTSSEGPLKLFNAFAKAVDSRPPGGHASYIYTGGSWTMSRGGGGLDKWTDERRPNAGRLQLTKWRSEVEKVVLTSEKVNGIVVRPGILYGRSGSLPGMMIFPGALAASKKGEKFEVIGEQDVRFGTIHQDDLADLFVRLAERAPICKGLAFVGHNPQSERLTDILDAVVRVSGAKGYTLTPPTQDPFQQAWGNSTTQLRPSLGEALVGWRPRKMSMVDGMDLYWSAFVGHQQS